MQHRGCRSGCGDDREKRPEVPKLSFAQRLRELWAKHLGKTPSDWIDAMKTGGRMVHAAPRRQHRSFRRGGWYGQAEPERAMGWEPYVPDAARHALEIHYRIRRPLSTGRLTRTFESKGFRRSSRDCW
jgi:hypothetical protein